VGDVLGEVNDAATIPHVQLPNDESDSEKVSPLRVFACRTAIVLCSFAFPIILIVVSIGYLSSGCPNDYLSSLLAALGRMWNGMSPFCVCKTLGVANDSPALELPPERKAIESVADDASTSSIQDGPVAQPESGAVSPQIPPSQQSLLQPPQTVPNIVAAGVAASVVAPQVEPVKMDIKDVKTLEDAQKFFAQEVSQATSGLFEKVSAESVPIANFGDCVPITIGDGQTADEVLGKFGMFFGQQVYFAQSIAEDFEAHRAEVERAIEKLNRAAEVVAAAKKLEKAAKDLAMMVETVSAEIASMPEKWAEWSDEIFQFCESRGPLCTDVMSAANVAEECEDAKRIGGIGCGIDIDLYGLMTHGETHMSLWDERCIWPPIILLHECLIVDYLSFILNNSKDAPFTPSHITEKPTDPCGVAKLLGVEGKFEASIADVLKTDEAMAKTRDEVIDDIAKDGGFPKFCDQIFEAYNLTRKLLAEICEKHRPTIVAAIAARKKEIEAPLDALKAEIDRMQVEFEQFKSAWSAKESDVIPSDG
jgi:hypothetical protein